MAESKMGMRTLEAIIRLPKILWDYSAPVILWLIRKFPVWKQETLPDAAIQRIYDLKTAKEILKVHPTEKEVAIRRRSLANERLSIAFNIENAFTTMDAIIHKNFVNEIKDFLKFSLPEEKDLITEIFEIEKDIFVENYGKNIPFKKYIMAASFMFSIRRFFDNAVNPQMTEKEISELCLQAAEIINTLWLESKTGLVDKNVQIMLFDTLKKMCPKFQTDDKIENPLGKILPSFETLWRVLYRLCLTINSDEKYIKMFREFGDNPSEYTYKNVKNDISVENFVKEILFCNPPTRTIYRRDENNNTVAIDVLKIHENYMGEEKTFYPQRWAKKESGIPFLTFGFSHLACPAKKYAPQVLGLMGAVIFKIFENYEWGMQINFSTNAEINDRNKYPDFDLKEVK